MFQAGGDLLALGLELLQFVSFALNHLLRRFADEVLVAQKTRCAVDLVVDIVQSFCRRFCSAARSTMPASGR